MTVRRASKVRVHDVTVDPITLFVLAVAVAIVLRWSRRRLGTQFDRVERSCGRPV